MADVNEFGVTIFHDQQAGLLAELSMYRFTKSGARSVYSKGFSTLDWIPKELQERIAVLTLADSGRPQPQDPTFGLVPGVGLRTTYYMGGAPTVSEFSFDDEDSWGFSPETIDTLWALVADEEPTEG